MNGSDSMPSPYIAGEVSNPMKVIFLLFLLFMTFLLIASSSIGTADLTPDTAGASTGASTESNVIQIQDNTNSQAGVQIPVTGSCTDPYTVRPGDILSAIAEGCNTTVAAIRQANPEITNTNIIYPGQKFHIPGAPAGQVEQQIPVPVTGAQSPSVVTNPTTPQQSSSELEALPAGAVVIRPGTGVQVKALNFPANSPVFVAIGPQNAGYNVVARGITDADGQLTSTILVPADNSGSPWIVVVATSNTPILQATSIPFYIR